jgi:GNAT superfamily N-acetyltransferase
LTQQKIRKKIVDSSIQIRRAKRADGTTFLSLINALADYEKLKRPDAAARSRLLRDAFGTHKRFDAYLAWYNGIAVGYAIIFETYSSFVALPTLYLEDIFILEEYRSHGIGRKLFAACLGEAKLRGCGRMEWVVLNWNKPAIRFYKKIGAAHMREWYTFRITRKSFSKILPRL